MAPGLKMLRSIPAALLCPPLPYAIRPSPNPFLPSTSIHYLTLPSPLLSSSPLPHCITLPPHSFSYPLLYSPTIPSSPFIPQLMSLPSNLPPLHHPSHLFPSLPSPRLPYSTLPPLPYPTIISPLLPFPRIPSPTYLPSLAPLSYLAFHTFRSPLTCPLASSTLSPTLPYLSRLSRPTLLYPPFYYYSLASPPLPTYPHTRILPLHSLPSAPLPCPLPYRTISIRTSLGAETFPSLPLL